MRWLTRLKKSQRPHGGRILNTHKFGIEVPEGFLIRLKLYRELGQQPEQ
jgi:hypothetical protein